MFVLPASSGQVPGAAWECVSPEEEGLLAEAVVPTIVPPMWAWRSDSEVDCCVLGLELRVEVGWKVPSWRVWGLGLGLGRGMERAE